MPFIVYDHGYRIKTPVETLYPRRGVEQLSNIKPEQHTASTEEHVHSDSPRFEVPEWEEAQKRSKAAQAYSNTNDQAPPTEEGESPLLASQVMSHPVHTIGPGATVIRTWQRMQSLGIHYMVVVSDADGHPLGVISDRDLLRHGVDSFDPIEPLYSKKLIAARPSTEVRMIAVTFLEREISCMPVVSDEDQVVGIICRTDLLRLLITGPNMERWA